MIQDRKQWVSAWARLEEFRNNLSSSIDEEDVETYHGLLRELTVASGEFLNEFTIPREQMKPELLPVSMGVTRRTLRRTRPSRTLVCDVAYFRGQIEGLRSYLTSLNLDGEHNVSTNNKDYWSMSDSELEHLATKYHIPSISRTGEHGESWYVDRTGIIDELLKRDKALTAGQPPPSPSNIIHVAEMSGSVIQQGSPGSTASITFQPNDARLANVVNMIVNSLEELQLTPLARKELDSDILTLQAQLAAPHPKSSIVMESLRSTRNILEGAIGSMAATGILIEIAKILSN